MVVWRKQRERMREGGEEGEDRGRGERGGVRGGKGKSNLKNLIRFESALKEEKRLNRSITKAPYIVWPIRLRH